jgi:hypothetical protein
LLCRRRGVYSRHVECEILITVYHYNPTNILYCTGYCYNWLLLSAI